MAAALLAAAFALAQQPRPLEFGTDPDALVVGNRPSTGVLSPEQQGRLKFAKLQPGRCGPTLSLVVLRNEGGFMSGFETFSPGVVLTTTGGSWSVHTPPHPPWEGGGFYPLPPDQTPPTAGFWSSVEVWQARGFGGVGGFGLGGRGFGGGFPIGNGRGIGGFGGSGGGSGSRGGLGGARPLSPWQSKR